MPSPSPQIVYMDNHATTRVDPRVVEAMLPYFDVLYGNPHSVHAAGHEDIGLSGDHPLGRHGDGLQSGGAETVDGDAGGGDRAAGHHGLQLQVFQVLCPAAAGR